jgi:hypothetical protein
MKAFGIILVGMGIALIIFTVISFFTESQQIISPIPESNSIKVILISTPTPKIK